MPAATMQTKTLERVATIAAGIGGIGAGRVSKGFKNYADADNWEETIRGLTAQTQGWFSCWLMSADNLGELQQGTFEMAGELAVYIPKDVSTDLVSAWDFALSVAAALLNTLNYQAGEGYPGSLSIKLVTVRSDNGGEGVAIFDFGAYGGGKMSFVDP